MKKIILILMLFLAMACQGQNYFFATHRTTSGGTIPTVITDAISGISDISATSGGNITSEGSASVSARGVCWNTSTEPTIVNSKTSDGTGTGTFVSSLTSLSASTYYHVRAYATNSVGTGYGNEVDFGTSTSGTMPSVLTNAISAITDETATGGGNVIDGGSDAVTARGVCWSTLVDPTTADSKTTNGTGAGAYTSYLTGLSSCNDYFVRAYATNSVGTAYGSNVTFQSTIPAIADHAWDVWYQYIGGNFSTTCERALSAYNCFYVNHTCDWIAGNIVYTISDVLTVGQRVYDFGICTENSLNGYFLMNPSGGGKAEVKRVHIVNNFVISVNNPETACDD